MIEEEIIRVHKRLISCLELDDGSISQIFIYLFFDGKNTCFKSFYKTKNSFVLPESSNEPIEIIDRFYQYANEDLKDLIDIYKKYHYEFPVHSLIYYDAINQKYETRYYYKKDKEAKIIPDEFFVKWQRKVQKTMRGHLL